MARKPPPTKNPITDAEKDRMVAMYTDEQLTLAQIASKTKRARQSVYNVLRSRGIEPNRAAPVGGIEKAKRKELETTIDRVVSERDVWKAKTAVAEEIIASRDRYIASMERKFATQARALDKLADSYDQLAAALAGRANGRAKKAS